MSDELGDRVRSLDAEPLRPAPDKTVPDLLHELIHVIACACGVGRDR